MTTTTATQAQRFYELSELARQHDDMAAVRAFDKAAIQWEKGTRAIGSADTWLIESRTSPGDVYRVRREGGVLGCNCKAGLSGRQCWHLAFVAGLESGEDFVPTPSMPNAPMCCDRPMSGDGITWQCQHCKYWMWAD